MFEIGFSIMPKDGILDPAGKAVGKVIVSERGLNLPQVTGVRVGRFVEATVDAKDQESASCVLDAIADTLFNPSVEQVLDRKVTEITIE